jgi:UDP-GlcNAc:undecaprenyl-phosphate GlcNAc-1-phosphate transferase
LLALGFSHAEAVSCIYALQSVFLLAAFLLRYQSDFAVLGVYLLICATILLLFVAAQRVGWRLRLEHDPTDRRRGVLRRFKWLYWGCRLYIEFAMTLFIWVMIYAMYRSFNFFSELQPVFLVSFAASVLLVFLLKMPMLNALIKLCVYITATFSGFILTSDYFNLQYVDWLVFSYLIILMAVIFIGIRVTRRNIFSFSTQDLLISLFAVAAVFLSETPFPVNFLFKLLCLAYAIEYLFNFQLRAYRTLKISALIAGSMVFIILMRGYDLRSDTVSGNDSLPYSVLFSAIL